MRRRRKNCRELANTRPTKELKAFFAFAKSLPTSAALIKREVKKCCQNLWKWVKIKITFKISSWLRVPETMPWSRLILLTSKLCVKILGHKILITKLLLGLDPQLGNNLLNSSWHWKQITNRAELGTSVWSKNVSSFFRVLIPRNNKTNNYD